ncbi:hypothetical protein LCGC14_0354290 [marine sediment metagenome]|uniref:NrS-1 polymerase-like helicase domain-containing protein n=1 Tax=marine sediment metagenome TaxID=412755 RepID=A0A0F9TFF1_9ZZZZ|nr:primase-helicase family protein [Maribacter sp.]HDZ04677.1 hypothetical protein [Maribacter sp.]
MGNDEFWSIDSKKKVSIQHLKLVQYIGQLGFANLDMGIGNLVLAKIQNNIVKETSTSEISKVILNKLQEGSHEEVMEAFTRGISGYIAPKKLELLPSIKPLKSADTAKVSWLYFKNCAVKITESNIKMVKYKNLPHKIWDKCVTPQNFMELSDVQSQFETFCFNISGKDSTRHEALMTQIGYLLSTYNDPGNPKAIIMIDQEMSEYGEANGGTGKSLLAKAVGILRNVVTIDGKHYNPTNPFGNQNIEYSTDILCFDDMGKNFNFETIFSMITSGITVNKKFKQAYYIDAKDAPKILINSNYIVRGPGGNADKRRRCEFEIAPHYDKINTPKTEFGNVFFEGWDPDEYNRFFSYMLKCAQSYLKKGLIISKPINLLKNRLVRLTSNEFVEFLDKNLKVDVKIDKRQFITDFHQEYPNSKETSSHAFTKMLKIYAEENGLKYDDQSSGGNYYFFMEDNNLDKEIGPDENECNNLQSPK